MEFPRPFTELENGCIVKKRRCPCDEQRDYTKTQFGGETWGSHRLSYHLNKEKIPRLSGSKKFGFVLHSCDNKACINPEHLSIGDAKRNVNEMFDRNPRIRENLSLSNKRAQNRPDQRALRSRLRTEQLSLMTQEDKKCMMDHARSFRSPDQPRKSISKFNRTVTREEKAEIARKGWITRREKAKGHL